jgi:hypothetical protein
MTNSVAERFIAKIRGYKKVDRVRGIRAAVYTTYNEVWIYVLYSGGTKQGKYWFGIDTRNVEDWRQQKSVVFCFICGEEDTVAFVPDDKLVEWFTGVEPNRKGQWMITIAPKDGSLMLQASGERQFDLTKYLNRFDFISKTIPVPSHRPTVKRKRAKDSSDVIAAIKSNPDLSGDSLHDRVIDMIAQIGKWSGYVPVKSYKVLPDSPYQIDVVWLNRDLLELAVEVQVGGNETEAKDRLVHAKRFGARKIVVVTKIESLKRLKEICRYEPDLKNWLEIWSVAKIYRMYLAGQQFFELYQPFEKQQWSPEIREMT